MIKQYASPLQVGDTVRITAEDHNGEIGELKVIDTIALVGDFYGVYLDSIERIEVFAASEIERVSPEQSLLDEAVARAIALGRPFTDEEVFGPIWEQGIELVPQMDPTRFKLHREATKHTRRLWSVVENELPF